MPHCSIIDHLRTVLRSIDSDLLLELRAHEAANEGGFMSVSRQVFCYIDYLGALAGPDKGKPSDRAVSFMKTYLVRANPEYHGKCELMYEMWRHGTVHEFDAKVFASEHDSFRLHWGANNTSAEGNRQWHMKCLKMMDDPTQFHWWINLFQLVDDLVEAVKAFSDDLQRDNVLLEAAQARFEAISRSVDLDTKPRLKRQALVVIAGAKAIVDAEGSVVEEG